MFKIKLLIALLFIGNITVNAGNWDSILENDNISAEKSFLKVLSKDSTDFDALIGMIYLSETKKDNLSYDKYLKSLVKNYPNEMNLFLFQDDVDFDYEEMEKLDVDDRLKLTAKIEKAEKHFSNREFEESKKIINEINSDLTWSIIGPFENLSGSAYEEVFAPETNPHKNSYTEYEYEFQKNWFEVKQPTPMGGINFSSFLPNESTYNTYYAKSNFSIKEDKTVSLNLTRNSPIKIWLDDNLIFSSDENMNKIYDFEQFEVDLKSGNHSILVKSTKLPREGSNGNLFSMYSGYSDFNFYNFNFNNFSYNGGSSNNLDYYFNFLIRVTDENGNKVAIENTAESGVKSANKVSVKQSDFDVLDQIKNEIKTADNKWPYYYLIEKIYSKLQKKKEGEEFIYKVYKENKSLFYIKYILAKFYEKNNKSNEVYTLLESINHSKTPMFSLLSEKFESLDKDANEKLYLSKLAELSKISPSNHSVIRSYIDYYIDKGMNKEKKKYLEKIVSDYPSLEERYSEYLEDENYKPEIYKSETDEEKKEEFLEALAAIDTSYSSSYYYDIINYYKDNEINDSVVYYYDEMIKVDPLSTSAIVNKCKFLYGLEKYDEAQEALKEVIKTKPYRKDALTMLGDINFDLKKNDIAKDYYEQALIDMSFNPNNYSYSGILTKLRKITAEEDYTNLLKGKSMNDVLKDKKWKSMYEDEDAFLIYYTKDIFFKPYSKIDVISKVAIKINTEEASRELTELDYSHFGKLTTVKIIKKNKAEVIPDYSGSYIVIKNLEPGDIIVVEGVIKDIGYIKNSVSSPISSEFIVSSQYPTYYTKFEVVLPEDEEMYFTFFNMENLNTTPKTESKNNKKTYTWEFNDLAKHIYEEGTLADWELLSIISFTNVKNWNDVANWYLKTTYKKTDFTYELQEILDSLDLYNDEPRVQVEKLYNYITEHIDYSNVSFLQSNYVPKSSNVTCSEKIGDCKDVATVMLAFLKKLNIESYYALVRTNNYSYLDFPPSLTFDHVIVAYKIDDEFEYMDLTSDYSPYFVLNNMDNGAFSLLIKEDSKEIFNLPIDQLDKDKNQIVYNSDVNFNADNSVKIVSKGEYKGMIGGSIKEVLNTTPKEEIKLILNDYINNSLMSNIKLDEYSLENATEITAPLTINYDMSVQEFTSSINDLIIFNIPFISPLLESNAFQTDERKFDFYPGFVLNTDPLIENINITIPKDFEIPKIPKSVNIDDEFVKYDLSFEIVDQVLKIKKEMIFKQRMVKKESFDKMKETYHQIIKAESQKLYYSPI